MIDINLMPIEKQRRRKKGGFLPLGFVLPREVIIGLLGGFLVLLAMGHILLQTTIFVKYIQLKYQQEIWQNILPAKTAVDTVMKDLQSRQLRYKAINDIRGCANISWAGKLNMLSNSLPRGIWLQNILLEDMNLLVKGGSVSKHKMEKVNIYNYVKRLKQSEIFMTEVASIDVESVKSRQIGDASTSDFVIRIMLQDTEE